MNPRADITGLALVTSAASGFALPALLGDGAPERNHEDDAHAKGFEKVPAIEMKLVTRALEEFVSLSLDKINSVAFVDHFETSFAVPEAISIAFTMR